ncbi:MAG: ABC transporter permease [Hyphomicrobiales bacterium]|nr:ABC transporter permease [Hyphomicrobiales bacterium]
MAGATSHAGWSPSNLLRSYGIFFAFLVLFVFLFVGRPQFGTIENLTNVLQQNAVIGIIACGMTFAIIAGGFDLSVGAATALSSVVGAALMVAVGPWGVPLGVIGAVAACAVVGVVNGGLIAFLRINPFVVTLGTMTIVRGLIYVTTNATPIFGVPYGFTEVGLGRVLGVPVPTIFFAIVALILGFVLHRTRFGHYVFIVGGNPKAASDMGVDPRPVRMAVYVLVSLCAALGGIILIGQTASGQPNAALGYELTAIAAVIVGGATLGGGRGHMAGTIVGVLLLGIVSNGLNLFGVSPFWQPVATGMILVVAVGLDRSSASKW